MLLTQSQADYLLALPKEVKNEGKMIDLSENKIVLDLVSPEDDEWKFSFHIFSSTKISFRINLHHQEARSKTGLLRIDFGGRHCNPVEVNHFVPNIAAPFAGKWIEKPHIHFFVESYSPLAWAIPLTEYKAFPVLVVNNKDDLLRAVLAFSDKINITSHFSIQHSIL
ncbi:DUF6978 family protein [Larkinella bovis]|uniref:DUF6978 family protein n=1 Tax=Larkinella bovis TaxID=683041 RepID=A0ABW0IKC0_9BACT